MVSNSRQNTIARAGGQQPSGLVDASGQPLSKGNQLQSSRIKLDQFRQMLRAKFDAAQTFSGNENHWSNADHFDPHTVASLHIRRTLRSRSRYEVIENNPYLKGTVLTIVNDFVGSGPKLQITDKRISPARRRIIEEKWNEWCQVCRIRQKLWRMRMAKIVDGETFLIPFVNKDRYYDYPIPLDFHIIECDRVSSPTVDRDNLPDNIGEIDGVRFNQYEQAIAYYIMHHHPGGGNWWSQSLPGRRDKEDGKWFPARNVIHWFRQDRGWLRGIPETTPSLPLCAILRRYTLAMVRNAEACADVTAVLETDGPGAQRAWTDGMGNPVEDDPFDIFPFEMGMLMTLPWSYTMNQLESVPHGQQYDAFVGSVLREISRPLMSPYNITSGSSKDSNMASGVLDATIYKDGQKSERMSCEEDVLDRILPFWWFEAINAKGFVGDDYLRSDRIFARPPQHRWRWDKIGIDHTDPAKVAQALEVLHTKRFMTDADVQELYYNRSKEAWQEEILEDDKFRQKLKPVNAEENPKNMPKPAAGPGGKGSSPPKKKPAGKGKPAKARRRTYMVN
jgi:hypothetical protein